MPLLRLPRASVLVYLFLLAATTLRAAEPARYGDLTRLFAEWRAFEQPALHDGVPDYAPSAIAAEARELPQWQARLNAIDTTGWSATQRNDWRLVQAEMNGLDFNLRVLQPWARDPAFYVSVWAARSDCPLREGPLVSTAIELYRYHFPLSPGDERELTARLNAIAPLLDQARANLKDSNARDLWVFGEQELRNQATYLTALQSNTLTV
ncbi:MAG TPA: hypothetical protein VN151_04630, partial [Terracidiphilus sp.]|nr:hypothetical protein [Terracidiphilus sp.]